MGKIFTPSLFPEIDFGNTEKIVQSKYKERWQKEKAMSFGLELCAGATFSGKYGIPKLQKFTGNVPKRFVTLDELSDLVPPNTGVLGFSHDYKLNELLCKPDRYISKLLKYSCVGEPDFSMRIGDPLAAFIASSLRSHCVAYYLQKNGCSVIPTMKWADTRSYDVGFDGYERGGIVLISTMGVLKDERSHMYFVNGFTEMLKRVSPDAIIIYGDIREWIVDLFPNQLTVYFVQNEHLNRMRSYGRKRCI